MDKLNKYADNYEFLLSPHSRKAAKLTDDLDIDDTRDTYAEMDYWLAQRAGSRKRD